jgi:hypothetical protein
VVAACSASCNISLVSFRSVAVTFRSIQNVCLVVGFAGEGVDGVLLRAVWVVVKGFELVKMDFVSQFYVRALGGSS